MSWCEEHREQWKEIIETVAAEEHRTTQMVEKDTIQSMILLRLSKCDIPFVFKGGTSLSKCYGLIDRFSEDIDLAMIRKPTESEKKKTKTIITGVGKDMGIALMNTDDIQSRYSFNRYVFEYESLFSDIPLELIVETSFYNASYPVEIQEVRSIVGSFCWKRRIELPVPFEASFFKMHVQSLERTFIDKVFAICDYRIRDKKDRNSRHLYDIAKLLPRIEIADATKDLIAKVREDRMRSMNSPSAQREQDIPQILKEIVESHYYESDYNTITKRLLFEDVPYDEAIENGIAKAAEMGIFT